MSEIQLELCDPAHNVSIFGACIEVYIELSGCRFVAKKTRRYLKGFTVVFT